MLKMGKSVKVTDKKITDLNTNYKPRQISFHIFKLSRFLAEVSGTSKGDSRKIKQNY